MINREMQKVVLKTYGGTDEYGQMLTEAIETKNIEMTFGIAATSLTSDVRYTEVTHYGLTKEKVNDHQSVLVNDKEYKILYVIPHTRINEVYLCLK